MKRRLVITSLFLLAATSSAVAQPVAQPFSPNEVKLLPSRFLDNRQRDSLWIASIPVRSLLHSFRNTAGVFTDKEGGYMTMRHLGGWESLDCDLRGHTTGHLLSAMAWLCASDPNGSSQGEASQGPSAPSGLQAKADSLVQGLAEVQRQYGTGYLSAFGEGLIDRNIAGQSVWAPFYTLHKLLQGLIDQYRLCGNNTALEVARGMGDWAYRKLQPLPEETRRRMLRNEFGGFNDAMYQLYAITRDERHLWVARFFYHNEKVDPLKARQADLGTNHANTFIPKLLGECRNYELFGDEQSRAAAALLFRTLTQEHAFVTGEVSDHEHLFDPQTPSKHLTGYDGENCCTYNLLKLADRLFTYEPSATIVDYYERALYNHILGQQDPQSSMVCYFTPLQTGAFRLYSTPDSSFWCCVGSGFESHAKFQSSIYFKGQRSEVEGQRPEVYINLFIPSELHFDGITIRQETRFPHSNKTTLTVNAPDGSLSGLTLKLRYPYWATYMKVNGKKVKAGKDGYATIKWSKVEGLRSMDIEFGMTLREEPLCDDASRVALMYGPIVLAGELEPVDHPFSDPHKYNDYYTYDYGQHPDVGYHALSDFRRTAADSLLFTGPDGIVVRPLYDLHHHRYVVYWKKK